MSVSAFDKLIHVLVVLGKQAHKVFRSARRKPEIISILDNLFESLYSYRVLHTRIKDKDKIANS